ncbi:MAG: hypothetical protein ACT4OS_09525 [Acidimicrobiales bacterium]
MGVTLVATRQDHRGISAGSDINGADPGADYPATREPITPGSPGGGTTTHEAPDARI